LGSPLYHEYVADISKSVEQLNVLMLKMLHFGRALSEEIALEEDQFPIRSFLEDCVAAAGESAERRGIEISSHFTVLPELRCFGDKSLLGQAFRSIVENAIKLSPRGSEVEVTARIDTDGKLVFAVIDAGPVLTTSQIHSILRSAGSGLSAVGANTERDVGLTVSRLLVDAHGGQLDLKPLPGEGTMACIVLPARRLGLGHALPQVAMRDDTASATEPSMTSGFPHPPVSASNTFRPAL
jgi:signal transduction histidine kinase